VTPADDRGESLLELVISVAILGLAVVAIVGGLGTGILVSDVHRKQATAGTAARNYAESVTNKVAGGGYQDCAPAAHYATLSGFVPPSGFAASASISYWNGTRWLAPSEPCVDTGLQRLTVDVASADGRVSERVAVVLRKPCGLSEALCD
jgi:type II secretory pathway pseudopilin PulG